MEIKVVKNIMKANDQIASRNRENLNSSQVFCLNVMASPGAGKTTFILKLIEKLKGQVRVGVIEGDLSSSVDAKKVGATGTPVVQINTEGGCHLDANQLSDAFPSLPLEDLDLVIIENVGNLICTAGYDLGEHKRIVISSVPEGDDKPWKYPTMFNAVDGIVISKTSLLQYMDFKVPAFTEAVRAVNREVEMFEVDSVSGEGMDQFVLWLKSKMEK